MGHIVSSDGIEVDKAKIDLIFNLSTPKNIQEVRSFLGHAGFYRRLIKDFSSISRPLCNPDKRKLHLSGLKLAS